MDIRRHRDDIRNVLPYDPLQPHDPHTDLSRRGNDLFVLPSKLREAYKKTIVNCGTDRY